MARSLYDRNYVLLNASNFLYSLYSTVFVFLPLFLYRLGARAGEIGLLMATGTLVSVALKPLNGFLVDRGGRRAFLIAGTLLASAATVPWLFVSGKGLHLFAFRALQGAAHSFFATASYAYIAASAPPERRGEAMGVFGLSFFVPAALGGWLGEWVIRGAGFHGLFLAGAVVALLSGFPPFGMQEPDGRARLPLSEARAYLTRPYLVPNTAGFLFGVAYGTIFTFLPVFLVVRKVSSIGVFVVVYALSVIASRTLARGLADRISRAGVSLFSLLLLALGILSIPFIDGPVELTLAAVLAGTGHGFLFPALSALILDRAEAGHGGMAMAMFTGAFDMGLVVGAALFGFVAESRGYPAMFLSAALLTAAGAAVFFLLDPAFRRASLRAPGP